MADPQNPAAGSTPDSSGQPQPTEFKVPEGKVLADRAEYERNNARLTGMQGYYEAGSKHGLKKPEDFESVGKWRKFEDSLKAKGMTTEQIMAAFEAPPEREQSGDGGPFDATKYLTPDQLEARLTERDNLNGAMNQHTRAMEAEPALVAKILAEALPETADPRDKRALAAEIRAAMADRSPYPDNHLLRQREYAPWNEAGIKGLVEKAKKELTLSEGAEMAAIGKKAAAAKPVGTPAGNRASQGKPQDEPPASANERMDSAAERWAKKNSLV